MKKYVKGGWGMLAGFIVFVVVALVVKAESVYDTDTQGKFIGGYGAALAAQATQFYEIDAVSATVVYFRYSGKPDKVFIKKITTTGTVTSVLKAFDLWANRLTATYTPIND